MNGAERAYRQEVLEAPPALVDAVITIIDQTSEVSHGAARQGAVAVPSFEYTD